MYCKKCGNELRDDALFCPRCGAKVGFQGESILNADTNSKSGFSINNDANKKEEKKSTGNNYVQDNQKKKSSKKKIFGVVAVLIAIIAVVVVVIVVNNSETPEEKAYREASEAARKLQDSYEEVLDSISEASDNYIVTKETTTEEAIISTEESHTTGATEKTTEVPQTESITLTVNPFEKISISFSGIDGYGYASITAFTEDFSEIYYVLSGNNGMLSNGDPFTVEFDSNTFLMYHPGYNIPTTSYTYMVTGLSEAATVENTIMSVVGCEKCITLRSEPDNSDGHADNRICNIPLYSKVEFIELSVNGFCKISFNGYNGYVLTDYLSSNVDYDKNNAALLGYGYNSHYIDLYDGPTPGQQNCIGSIPPYTYIPVYKEVVADDQTSCYLVEYGDVMGFIYAGDLY